MKLLENEIPLLGVFGVDIGDPVPTDREMLDHLLSALSALRAYRAVPWARIRLRLWRGARFRGLVQFQFILLRMAVTLIERQFKLVRYMLLLHGSLLRGGLRGTGLPLFYSYRFKSDSHFFTSCSALA